MMLQVIPIPVPKEEPYILLKKKKQHSKTGGYERTIRIYQCENCRYYGKRKQCQSTRTGTPPKQDKTIRSNPY